MKSKSFLFWLIAVIVTLGSAVYQRATGPTHPYRGSTSVDGQEISFRLIRSSVKPGDAPVTIEVPNRNVTGSFRFKRYPSHDEWQQEKLIREGDMLVALLPELPAAGKVMYSISLETDKQQIQITEEPIVLRFRNDVPAWAMIPHILLMFAAMLFSARAGLAAIFNQPTKRITILTFGALILGGLFFGPIIQKYAFGDYWTGWPMGTDLTDNKTAVAFIFWLIAIIKVWKNPKHRSWVLIASIVMLLVYMIPHSLLGSEIDWTQDPLPAN